MAKDAYKQPWQVAALLAYMMGKTDRTRARISDKGLKALAGRQKLETSIREAIRTDLLDYGYLLHRLDGSNGASGNVVLSLQALASAKPFNRQDVFSDEEWKSIRDGSFDFDSLHNDLSEDDDEEE